MNTSNISNEVVVDDSHYLSRVHYEAQAGEVEFPITFEYNDIATIKVIVDLKPLEYLTDYTFASSHVVRLNAPLDKAARVTIRRETDLTERVVDFVNAAELTEADLDNSANQVFFAMQEAYDNSLDTIEGSLDGNLTAGGKLIHDVADPELPMDAVNKQHLDSELKRFVSITDAARNKAIEQANRSEREATRAFNEANRSAERADHATEQATIAESVKEHVLEKTEEGIQRLQAEGDVQHHRAFTEANRARDEADRAAANATLSGMPLGSYVWFPAHSKEDVRDRYGLLIPNGRELDRDAYSDLWQAIQRGDLPSVSDAEWLTGQKAVFSTGNGSTTFRLPSIGGYFVRVAGEADPEYETRKLGAVQESCNKVHGHEVSETDLGTVISSSAGEHTHTGTVDEGGVHDHTYTRLGGSNKVGGGNYYQMNTVINATTNPSDPHTHGLTIDAVEGHVHETEMGAHGHTATEEGDVEARPANVWMQPYLVWYQATNAATGGFRLRGSWDVTRNIVIGDPLNQTLSKDKAPIVENGATADGMGYLVVTNGYTDLLGEGTNTYMQEGDRVIWYGSVWIHLQHSNVSSVNEKYGDVVLTTEDIRRPNGDTIEETLLKLFPVGTVVFRMDDLNPETLYGGLWQLITGDASLSFGDGSVQTGDSYGDNDPYVPVPLHTHEATFQGNALEPHDHTGTMHYMNTYKSDYVVRGGYPSRIQSNDNGATINAQQASPKSAGTPTGSVTVQKAGTENATLDVRGARISINVWQRVE